MPSIDPVGHLVLYCNTEYMSNSGLFGHNQRTRVFSIR